MTAFVITPPVTISSDHVLDNFECGEPLLNEWLKKRALKNHISGVSRCFVICHNVDVIGYYSLSAGAIRHESVTKSMRHNMPDPLPVLLLGRLAVDHRYHNQGLGSALLRDAMIRAINVSYDAGIFALMVHTLSEQSRRFYLSRGFIESLIQPMTLIITLATVRSILSE